MDRTTEQLMNMIDMAFTQVSIVQIVLPPGFTKTSISKTLKSRGPWCTVEMFSPRVMKDMARRASSMNLIINHYPKREVEIPEEFTRQIVMLGHQATIIKNRPCIIIQYKPPKETKYGP